jgi:hypothetical protein
MDGIQDELQDQDEDDYSLNQLEAFQQQSPTTSAVPTNALKDSTNIKQWNASLKSIASILRMKENIAVSYCCWTGNSTFYHPLYSFVNVFLFFYSLKCYHLCRKLFQRTRTMVPKNHATGKEECCRQVLPLL